MDEPGDWPAGEPLWEAAACSPWVDCADCADCALEPAVWGGVFGAWADPDGGVFGDSAAEGVALCGDAGV